MTSVGAFTDTALFDRLLAAAKANGRRLILPSAGIGALDILSSAAVGGLDSVTVTVRKDPSAWKGTVAETLCDLDALTEPHDRVRRPGARGRAALSAERQHLRRRGDRRHRPRQDARGDRRRSRPSPRTSSSSKPKGAFGRFTFMEDVAVSEENRKTGKLVAMAMVKSVRQLASTLVVAA